MARHGKHHKRIPTVGTKGLKTAQLSPELRRILARRAKRAAQREYAPVLAADRAAFGDANRDYRTEARSVRGATSMVEGALAQALRGLKGSGLKGGYLRQTQKALTSRQGDAAASIPFLLADAASTRGKAISEARTQLRTDRASRGSAAASQFNQLLKEQRGKASSVLKSRAEGEGELKSDPRSVEIARMAALTTYKSLLQDSGKKTKDGTTIRPPWTDAEWRAFTLTVAKVEGADPVDAAEAVRRIRQQINKQVKQGNLRRLGIKFSGR